MRCRLNKPFGVFLALCFSWLVAGCADGEPWQTRVLPDDFPPLAFELVSGGGELLSAVHLEGKITLMFFGYLSCPDVCPTTMAKLQGVLQELPPAQRDQVRVLFVSIDPGRDDPRRLAEYAAWFGPQFIGATSEPARLRELTSRYGTSFEVYNGGEGGDYVVAHGTHILVFDRAGEARLSIPFDESREAIGHDLRRLLAS